VRAEGHRCENPTSKWGNVTKRQAMETLAQHGPTPLRRRTWFVASLLALAIVLVAAGAWIAVAKERSSGSGALTLDPVPPRHFAVVTTTPVSGAQDAASDGHVTVRFSAPLLPGAGASGPAPAFDPPVAGSWHRTNRVTLQFDPSAPFVPSATETLTVPGGPAGMRDATGLTLAHDVSVSFTVAQGSVERLEQLLALTGYLRCPTPGRSRGGGPVCRRR
jgi:hypothetical protein